MVSKGHSVPKDSAVARLIGFSVSILTNYILDSVKLTAAMVSIDHDLGPPYDGLFASMHEVVGMYFLLSFRFFLSLICFLLSALLTYFRFLISLHLKLKLLLLSRSWPRYFIILRLLIQLVLVHLASVFGC